MEEAIPALQEAELAVADISRPAITEIQALPQPPEVIKEVCSICFFLYPGAGTDTSWLNVKLKVLSDSQLLTKLKGYEVSKTKNDAAKRAR